MSYEIYNRTKKYYIYTRISKSADDENWYWWSPDNQLDLCLKTAKNLNIDESQITLVEEEESAFESGKREKFEAMLKSLEEDFKKHSKPKQIKHREFWWIIFFKVDRLARSYKAFERLDTLFSEWYELISTTETFENTPTWKLLLRMLCSFAIYESEKLSSRQITAQLRNLSKKQFASLWWKIAYWYNKIWNKSDDDIVVIKIDENKKDIIKLAYWLFLEHFLETWKKNYSTIADKINEYLQLEGSNKINSLTVWSILNNKGCFKYNWLFIRQTSIRDKVIKTYLNAIMEDNQVNAEIKWEVFVWWKVDFIYHLPEYQIVDRILYKKVRQIIDTKESKRKLNPWPTLSLLHWTLVYKDVKLDVEYNNFNRPQVINKEGKITIQHRIRVNWKKIEKSENKLVDCYFDSNFYKTISKWLINNKEIIKKLYSEALDSHFDKQIREITWRLLFPSKLLKDITNRLSSEEDIEERESLEITKIEYTNIVNKYESIKRTLVSDKNEKLDWIISILSSKEIKESNRATKKLYIGLLFEKVIFNSDNTVTYELSPLFIHMLNLNLSKIKNTWNIS